MQHPSSSFSGTLVKPFPLGERWRWREPPGPHLLHLGWPKGKLQELHAAGAPLCNFPFFRLLKKSVAGAVLLCTQNNLLQLCKESQWCRRNPFVFLGYTPPSFSHSVGSILRLVFKCSKRFFLGPTHVGSWKNKDLPVVLERLRWNAHEP